MSDLQATFEFSVELYKFYNVDLFQRGLYQVRVGLRVSPKVPVQIEASVASGNMAARSGRPASMASLIGGLAASRPFQIMYRNEEVTLRDIIHFRAHLLVDSRNLKDSLERAEWSLGVELWCGEGAASSTLAPVACRVLKLHFQPSQGLHYHLPVLFDYFHLAAVSITIHASLVALHQPYINTPRSSKQWGKLVKSAGSGLTSSSSGGGTLESVLFGSGTKCGGGGSSKIAHARQVHAEVCGILLGSLEGLQNALNLCGSAGTLLTPDSNAANSIVGEVAQRLKDLSELTKRPDTAEEEEFACGAANDIARLCAEVTLRWRSFLQATSDRPHVHHALAVKHHALRIKRFAECFFVLDNPRHSLAGCYDSNYQSYQTIGEAARRSRYLALLPPLPVHCIALDGDPHIMPIIFEDRYQDTAEFARRRSVLSSGTNKSGSDPFLCSEPLQDDCACSIATVMDSRRPSSEASRVTLTLPKTLILEPKLNAQKPNVVQATLTLTPQKCLNGSPKRASIKQNATDKKNKLIADNQMKLTCRNRYIVQNNQISEIQMPLNYNFKTSSIEKSEQLSRYSASTLLDINAKSVENIKACGAANNQSEAFQKTRKAVTNGVSTLPARHSKSLDQLKISQRESQNTLQLQTLSKNQKSTSNSTINCHNNQFIAQQMKPTTLPRSVTTTHTADRTRDVNADEFAYTLNRTSRPNTKEEEYRRNINEFREKYKNPCGANMNIRNVIGELIKSMDTNKFSNNSSEVLPNSANQMYRFGGGKQGNKQLNNFIHNPLEFQRSYAASLPRPVLPPRNSYPPVSGKNQYGPVDQSNDTLNKHIHRSNSTHAFHQNVVTNHQKQIDLARMQIYQELQSIIQHGLWNNAYDGSQVHETKSTHHKNKDLNQSVDKLIDNSICNTQNKTPPLVERVTQPPPRHKRNKLKDIKQHQSTKLPSRQLNASKESLSSHQSSKSRDSKSDRPASKSEKGTPKSERGTPKSDRGTPKSDKSTSKSDKAHAKVDKHATRNEKKCKHRVSEKMSQLISEVTSSSSNDSIPFALKRLESSASVPQRLDRTETLRHCRSAASVLDEQLVNNNLFSESLPNLAPPAAFGSPPLDITDNEFKIMPPDIFKNECDRRYIVSSTSSLSEQSGWVSSARTSGPSTPEITHAPVRNIYNTYPNPTVSKTLKLQEIDAINMKDINDHYDKNTGNLKRTVLNGDQLREKLLKLAVKVAQNSTENVECCNKLACQECEICSDSICTDSKCEFNRIQKSEIQSQCLIDTAEHMLNTHMQQKDKKSPTLRHNSFSAGQTLNSKAHNSLLNGFTTESSIKKSQTITEKLHPYIRKEMPTNMSAKPIPVKSNTLDKSTLKDRIEYTEKLLAAEIRSLTFDRMCRSHNKPIEQKTSSTRKYQNKCRSEVDLAHYTGENEYEHLKLPPPQQFRDIPPPPPDEFKDPPVKTMSKPNSKSSTPQKSVTHNVTLTGPLQLDNPLYHVCEGILERRQMRPLQSSASSSNTTTLNKSQSTGELASRNENDPNKEKRENDLVSIFGLAESERLFVKCRDEFRSSVKYSGALYSDFSPSETSLPYFHISDEYRMFNPEGLHLIICVHGLDGNSADLRLVKTYLELGLPGARLDFLMSERNQGDTFSDFDTMTERLVQEILHHIQTSSEPTRISFIGHSLGTIIIRSALARPQMKPLLGKLHTFLSLSGPHLGTLYNSSGLVNAGMWFMQKWKKSGSLLQLSLRDASDPRRSFLYRLSERSQLHQFKHVLLCGSGQDRYVPLHSARLELCKAAAKDTSLLGQAYREMVHNMVSPLAARSSTVSVVRYDVQHALPHTASALVGRAAHIAALDSDLFIEKFLLVSALKYFR